MRQLNARSSGMPEQLLGLLLLLTVVACSDDGGVSPDAGAGDTDTATETDTGDPLDLDCSECSSPVCISTISGRLVYEDETPVANIKDVKLCIPNCCVVQTDADGYFEYVMPGGCQGYDFDDDDALHLTVPVFQVDQYIPYVVAYTPTQDQVSDQSADDFDLDVGPQVLYELPASAATYTEASGAAVDANGVQFDVGPGELGDAEIDLGVFECPTADWLPSFLDNPFLDETVANVDALYFFSPYWVSITAGPGLVYRIDPPAGWGETDTGSVYVLGDYIAYYLEFPDETVVPRGEFVKWGPTSYEDGKLVTPPLPLLCWVGLIKD